MGRTGWTGHDSCLAGFAQHFGFGAFGFALQHLPHRCTVALCSDKGKGGERKARNAQKPTKELVGVEFAIHTHAHVAVGDLGARGVDVLGNQAILAGVDVEFKVVFAF